MPSKLAPAIAADAAGRLRSTELHQSWGHGLLSALLSLLPRMRLVNSGYRSSSSTTPRLRIGYLNTRTRRDALVAGGRVHRRCAPI
jgi:hypothetical protein